MSCRMKSLCRDAMKENQEQELNGPGFVEIGSIVGLLNSSLPGIRNSSLNQSFQCSTSHNFLPHCRQFWNAGEYSAGDAPQTFLKTHQNRMRVHPKFLHSNATSHKWAFGAIAELLDNAVDEACNGATSVIINKIANLGNSPCLLIQDDGGGMDPETIRHCMSFGFSNKHSNSSIGQYGNGFKTSTMRLGADVIAFSRCLKEGLLTQSVGILSYTFLRQTGCDDVLVPMVDYNFSLLTGGFVRMIRHSEKHFCDNLSTLLRWSPFSTEEQLLNQFDHIGCYGTRIIVFNLWLNDNGDPELDFDTDEKDILISGTLKAMHTSRFAKDLNERHIGNRFHYSLRSEEIGTVIGFINGAPHLNIHGFNIYHKYRLIMPFWRVVHKCKGVVGVLQVDCLKPTHDKQDFEKSDIFFKLEIRLKCMALEYWKYHCHLVGYAIVKVPSSIQPPSNYRLYNQETIEMVQEALPQKRKGAQEVEEANPSGLTKPKTIHINCGESSQAVLAEKENYGENTYAPEALKLQSVTNGIAPARKTKPQLQIQHGRRDRKQAFNTMVQRRKQLDEQCMELEKSVEELTHKEQRLRTELEVIRLLYNNLCADLSSAGKMDT